MSWFWSIQIPKWANTFEEISKNLKWIPYELWYISWILSTITYSIWDETIIKTFNYSLWKLTSIVLSWDIPTWVNTTKNFFYTWDLLSEITYT